MASIINSTTTNGLAISADNSGSLQIATNNGITAISVDGSQNSTLTGTLTVLSTGILNVGSGQIYKDNNGNVGLGTTNMISKLNVVGNVYATSNNGFLVGDGSTFTPSGLNAIPNYGVGYIATSSSTSISSFGTLKVYTSQILALTVDQSQNVLLSSPSALGYGTGAGGSVTQLTSRVTGVTLNKPTGSITLFSAAGATTASTFTVSNNLIAATDTIIVNQKSGTNLYVLAITAVVSGSFNITFYTTGGTATDAPVISFTIIRGAIS